MDKSESQHESARKDRAPWYLHLLWAGLGTLAAMFILAAFGFGGVEYGYIAIEPTETGGCHIMILILEAIPEEQTTRGCLAFKIDQCQIIFGNNCQLYPAIIEAKTGD